MPIEASLLRYALLLSEMEQVTALLNAYLSYRPYCLSLYRGIGSLILHFLMLVPSM